MNRTALAGTVVTAGALLLRAAAQAGTFLLLARHFAPEAYGQFVALVCVGVLLAPIVTAGTEYVIVAMVATRRAGTDECLGNGLMVLAGLAPLGILCAALYVQFALAPTTGWLAVSLFLVSELLCVPVLELAWRAYQAEQRMGMVGALRAAPAVLKFIAAGLLALGVYAPLMVNWAVAYAVASASTALVALGFAARHYGVRAPRPAHCWRAAREGWPFAGYSVAERTTNDVDKLLLASLAGAGSAGVYAAGYRLVEVFIMPLMAGLMTVNATIYRLGGASPRALRQYVVKLAGLMTGYGVVGAAALIAGADLVVTLLGTAYGESAQVLRTLALLPLLYGLRVLLGFGLAAVGRQLTRMTVQGVSAVLCIGLCLLAIPRFGVIGAACATVMTETMAIGVLSLLLWRVPEGAFRAAGDAA